MKIDYTEMTITLRGKTYSMGEFKQWFRANYQPLLGQYYISQGKFDWQAILSDVQNNGIIEIFENDKAS